MEKELLNSDKELLLKDLCARLPYGVMCATTDNDGSLPNIWEIVNADMINEDFFLIHDSYEASRTVDVKEARPYLFPLSSMTEEQKEEYGKCYDIDLANCAKNICDRLNGKDTINGYPMYNHIDWCNKNHFDYRGLIEKSLALDATVLNIY